MNELRQELLAAFEVEHREHLEAMRAALAAVEAGRPFEQREAFRRAHSLKGAARAVDLPAVEERAHRLEATFARLGEGQAALDAAMVEALRRELDGIEDEVAGLSTPPAVQAEAPSPEAPAAPAAEYLRVQTPQVEALAEAARLVSEALLQQSRLGAGMLEVEAALRGLRRRWPALGQAGAAGQGFAADMDGLLRQVGRLVREQRAAAAGSDAAVAMLRQRVERITLVPAEAVLGSLAPMLRELVREAGRSATLEIQGLDVQADRAVLQALKDPVTHLLRNAVSHGLEPASERLARGKPAEGTIALRLATSGGMLRLFVADDGPGPSLDRIEATAIAQGLLPPRRPDQPPPPQDQLLSLVFEPGFTTAAAVDRLSGRGIGLSVVAEAARRLRGSVVMRPRRPAGTEIELAVPLAAARQPVLLVEAAGQNWGLPGRAVERLMRLRPETLESVEGRPVLRIESEGRDVIVPVVNLASLLQQSAAPAGRFVQAVLLRSDTRRLALVVDRLREVQVLDVEAVEVPLAEAGLVVGAAPLMGEAPAVVLSPEALVGRWLRQEGQLAAAGFGLAPPAEAEQAATILVVDDSITTRTLEKSILEAQGFRVLLSVDGVDALNRLRSGDVLVDLIVADVEMPRMDGFALLQALKNDSRLASIPVILMTSRADPEDVRRGLELGAGAYITKQKFDQRELLATIGQLL
ncbi:hybrid sensor histidine kinase/response regulator [Teichococcus oryzae]|uniref:Chemotaxis protein CheA n=1 Tax=Teichococcus oryzae TaxID=1608942 RepID=A0A5B2TDZ6_9PROT|nr:response regulator [Pseudoroseomonas oryzae]KAA2212078.1 response regulator [Pseudoroseomonas oryzae]